MCDQQRLKNVVAVHELKYRYRNLLQGVKHESVQYLVCNLLHFRLSSFHNVHKYRLLEILRR
jgi:hypothetical protein